MTLSKSTKRKLLRTRIALRQTVYRIFRINRERRKVPYSSDPQAREQAINDELKVLNKIAEKQAALVQLYEHEVQTVAQHEREPEAV